MPDLLELRQVVSALLGAAIALLGQSVVRRAAAARTGKRLAVAFWEELSAVNFYGSGAGAAAPNFAGFSSQTFDTLFREMAQVLPEHLSRDLMRYHWRMKYLEETKSVSIPTTGGVNRQFFDEGKALNHELRQRLNHYGKRSLASVFFRPGEVYKG